jgi:hypothetical protein
LEFDGEVFFTDCVMPQAIASVHSALRAKDKNRVGGGMGVMVKPKGEKNGSLERVKKMHLLTE